MTETSSSHGRSFRFTRQFRLKSPLAIRRILQDTSSSRRRLNGFRLVWSKTSGVDRNDAPRFAFVVSRDAGPAVMRNRIKRRLREAVRTQRDLWPAQPVDIIFRVNDPAAGVLSFTDLSAQVSEALLAVKGKSYDG